MQDMFHNSGLPNNYDGRCASCPFRTESECTETGENIERLVYNGYINSNCPFITK